MQQGVKECRAFGVVHKNQDVPELAALLRGLCSHYRVYHVEEVVLNVPLQGGTASTELRVARHLGPAAAAGENEGWIAIHEGLPAMGPTAASLPAAVREITESRCYTSNVPDFWISLGAQHAYTMTKKGNEYLCSHAGMDLHVAVITLVAQPGAAGPPSRSAKYIVDVRVKVPDNLYVEAAQAIGSFGAKLAPMVTLQPAVAPRGG